MEEGLSRADALDSFQTNVSVGVILSTPSLLFPSSSSPRPSNQILSEAIAALATRLIQVTHQEAAIRSLVKIHEIIGHEEFNYYLNNLDINAKRDYEVLCDVYELKPSEKNARITSGKKMKKKNDIQNVRHRKQEEQETEERKNELNKNKNDNDGDEQVSMAMRPARVVLETEIKFNEETAITMTILEEKGDGSENDDDDELAKDEDIILEVKNDAEYEEPKNDDAMDAWIERRKTPRRVHFGGEIVKLRTPDSDDSEMTQTKVPLTRIPLPISPSTKMPEIRPRRSLSNPCSPNVVRTRSRKSRSVSNSPKREFYMHDATLSPKKSILLRTTTRIVHSFDDKEIVKMSKSIGKKIMEGKVDKYFGKEETDSGWAFEVCDNQVPIVFGLDKFEVTKNSSGSVNERETQKRRRSLTKVNFEGIKINEFSEVNENVKVENAELVKAPEIGVALVESLVVPAEDEVELEVCQTVKETEARMEEEEEKEEEKKDTREVKVKLEASNERNVKSSVDSQNRSPRSPKKLVFESFPRKERNYILMELSSPVKTSPRKINEEDEPVDSQRLGVPENSVVLSRVNSPMGTSTNDLGNELEVNKKVEIDTKNEKFEPIGSPIPSNCSESNWEELGLVDEEVLNDLHNKVKK